MPYIPTQTRRELLREIRDEKKRAKADGLEWAWVWTYDRQSHPNTSYTLSDAPQEYRSHDSKETTPIGRFNAIPKSKLADYVRGGWQKTSETALKKAYGSEAVDMQWGRDYKAQNAHTPYSPLKVAHRAALGESHPDISLEERRRRAKKAFDDNYQRNQINMRRAAGEDLPNILSQRQLDRLVPR